MNGVDIHFMRHGAPEDAGTLLGHRDSPPTDDGIARCIEQAATLEPPILVTSDLARARLAAERISDQMRVPLRIDARWRELDFGEWDGMHPDAIDPAALGAFWADPDGAPPPAGERWADLCSRVSEALGAIRGPCLVVAHAGSIRAALSVLCEFDYRQGWAFDLPYASVLTVRIYGVGAGGGQIIRLVP